MRVAIRLSVIAGLVIVFHLVMAGTIQCPKEIKVNQSLKEKIDTWGDFADDMNDDHQFDHVTFYAGHPKEHASLAPDNENTKGKKLSWTFGKEPIWLACGYLKTDIELIKKLPDNTTKCTVTYNSNFSRVTDINCR